MTRKVLIAALLGMAGLMCGCTKVIVRNEPYCLSGGDVHRFRVGESVVDTDSHKWICAGDQDWVQVR